MLKIIIAVLIVFVLLLVFYRFRKRKITIPTELQFANEYTGEMLGLEQVVQWFQQQLNQHPEYKRLQALLLKPDAEIFRKAGWHLREKAAGKILLVQGFFDKETEQMPAARTINVNRITHELYEMFGDKSIVVFT